MMTSWFNSSSQLDEQIDKATSSSLEDIALNLEISDIIRSKSVGSKEAMRLLKKRLESKNPNTQLSTLNLTDTCVKNGGSHFLTEIASREYIDNLVSLMKAHGGGAVNEDVKTKILELIQGWATATEGQQEFSYIGETYSSLLREGFQFPPKVDIAKSMLVSCAPPEWTDSDVCMRCRAAFTFTNRKHHCRNCGHVFDHQCSSKTLPLPHFGITQAVRVDDGCYVKLTQKPTRGYPLTDKRSPNQWNSRQQRSSNPMQPRSARIDDVFDEDFKKALAMSLEDYKGHSRNDSAQKTSLSSAHPNINGAIKRSPSRSIEEEEDKDLKSAIAASLADMEEQKIKHSAKIKVQSENPGSHNTSSFIPRRNDHTLTPVEVENVNLFSNLVDRLQTQPHGAVLKEPQIQELYENIVKLRPKIARTYGETMSKHDSLLELHAKLSTVVRFYDRLLEQRLSNTYNQHSIGSYKIPPRSNSSMTTTISPDILNGSTEGFYTSNFQGERRSPLPSTHESHQTSHNNNGPSITNARPASGPGISEYSYIQYSQPQRVSSWNTSMPSIPLVPQHSIYSENSKHTPPSTQQQSQFMRIPQPHVTNEPSENLSVPNSEPNVAFYHNSPEPSALHPSNLQQQTSVPETTPQTPNKLFKTLNNQPHSRNPPPQILQDQAFSYQQQVPSQQRLANNHQQWHATPHVYENFNPDHFPHAPQHTLKPPTVEECLIEL